MVTHSVVWLNVQKLGLPLADLRYSIQYTFYIVAIRVDRLAKDAHVVVKLASQQMHVRVFDFSDVNLRKKSNAILLSNTELLT